MILLMPVYYIDLPFQINIVIEFNIHKIYSTFRTKIYFKSIIKIYFTYQYLLFNSLWSITAKILFNLKNLFIWIYFTDDENKKL